MSELKARDGDRCRDGDTKHPLLAPASSSCSLDIKSAWADCRETGFVTSQLEESSSLCFPSSCAHRPDALL